VTDLREGQEDAGSAGAAPGAVIVDAPSTSGDESAIAGRRTSSD
jgi:hypothetical protein